MVGELEVGAQLVPLELREVGPDALVDRDKLGVQDLVCVHQERLVRVVLDDLLGERHLVLTLEVLADLGDVPL